MKQVAHDCLHNDTVRDELLSAKPLFNLVANDGSTVTVESWPKMIQAKNNDIIRLKLLGNLKLISGLNRSLVTYLDEDGDTMGEPDADSEFLSSMNSGEDSDSNKSSTSLIENDRLIRFATDKLRRMQFQLENNNRIGRSRRDVSRLQERIVDMEEQILGLITEKSRLEDLKLAGGLGADGMLHSYESPKPAQGTNQELKESLSIHPGGTFFNDTTSSSQQSRESELHDTRERARPSLIPTSATDSQQIAFRAVGSNPQLDQPFRSHKKEASRVQFLGQDLLHGTVSDQQSALQALQQPSSQKSENEFPTDFNAAPNASDVPIFLWLSDRTSSRSNEPVSLRYLTQNSRIIKKKNNHHIAKSDEKKTVGGTAIVTTHPTESTLEGILGKIHTQLQDRRTSTTTQAQKARLYSDAPEKSVEDVETMLSSSKNNDQKTSSQKMDIFDLARKIITVWVPENCEVPVIKKYWGGVYRLLDEGGKVGVFHACDSCNSRAGVD